MNFECLQVPFSDLMTCCVCEYPQRGFLTRRKVRLKGCPTFKFWSPLFVAKIYHLLNEVHVSAKNKKL